jgi:LuxR family maltose regulon positive regulatory protein
VWSLCFSLQYERAFSALQSLDHRLAEVDPGGHRAVALRARLGLLRVVISIHLDLLDTASEDAQRWLVDAVERDPLGVATVATGAAIAELARGNPGMARRHMQTADGAIGRSDSAYGSGWVALINAAIDLTDGDPVKADRLLTQARPMVVAQLGEDAAVVSTMDFVHARALHDLGRVPEARAKALKGLVTASTHGINETAQHGLAACVALWDGSEDSEFAPASLDRVVTCYAPRTQRQVAVHQLRRLLLLGRTDDAKEFAYRHMLMSDIDEAREGPVGQETLLCLEWSWTVGQKRGLPERIERFKKLANTEQRWRELLQVHLLELNLHSQGGDTRRAQRSLAQALFVAARRRLVQPMVDRLSQLQPILSQVSNRELGLVQPDEIDLLSWLTELIGGANPAEAVSTEAGLAEPMTRRERELLELLDKGLSNQQIADRVNLSVPTVKWHFYKLFAKLQVKNRSAALVKARSLNLLR